MTLALAKSGVNSRPLNEAALYRRIIDIAHTAARGLEIEPADADDVAQDVAYKCFILNDRRSIDLAAMPANELEAYVSRLAGRGVLRRFRTVERAARRDAEFERERSASVYEWCRPDSRTDAALYNRALNETLAKLGLRTRRIFSTVREGGLTHAEAAEQLGISASSVSRHMLLARKAFEATLELLELPYQHRRRVRQEKPRRREESGEAADANGRGHRINAATEQTNAACPDANVDAHKTDNSVHARSDRGRQGMPALNNVTVDSGHLSAARRELRGEAPETKARRTKTAVPRREQKRRDLEPNSSAIETQRSDGQQDVQLQHAELRPREQGTLGSSDSAMPSRPSPTKHEPT